MTISSALVGSTDWILMLTLPAVAAPLNTIPRASKIDKALIMLEQGMFGTTSENCVDSTG